MKISQKPSMIAFVAATAFFTFFACTKETHSVSAGKKPKAPVTATEKVPPIGGTLTVGTSCGTFKQCTSLTSTPGAGYNEITFSKNSSTIMYFPNLRFTIYKQSGSTSTYTKIAEFTCTNNITKYSNINLDNSTQHILVLTDGSVPFTTPPSAVYNPPYGLNIASPEIMFTTGTGKSKSC